MEELPKVAGDANSLSPHASGSQLTRRGFLTAAGLSTAGMVFYSGEIVRHDLEIVHQTIHIAHLPSAFHGLRIAQLSDIHYDNFSEPGFIRHAVDHINTLAPDLVLFTGDYVSKGPEMATQGTRHAHLCAEILSTVTCPQRFAILGNHDVSVGAEMVAAAITAAGIPVLIDSYHALERDGQRLWLVGLRDTEIGPLPDLDIATPPALPHEPILLMVHEPDFTDTLLPTPLGARTSLVLSGHSHGGQIRLPLLGPIYLPPMGQKYVSGLFRFPAPDNGNTLQLYVNRGLGTVGLPLRFHCRPELTLLTLSAEPA